MVEPGKPEVSKPHVVHEEPTLDLGLPEQTPDMIEPRDGVRISDQIGRRWKKPPAQKKP